MLNRIKSFLRRNKYADHKDAVIITCFYNPTNSAYRLAAFNKFYNSIKHLNHRIIECVIGDSKPQLKGENISVVFTDTLLWHKESLLNKIIKELPAKFKYVFWVDADVLFTNKNWLVESVERLLTYKVIQPFEYCIHLEQDEVTPSFNVETMRRSVDLKRAPKSSNGRRMWRSFCSNHVSRLNDNTDYDTHGHVGFAWGARREVLDACPLYDKALIGGADHIIAHAAAGHIPHNCITNAFKDDIYAINDWSDEFYNVVRGEISYTKGDLYHIWHGDIKKREYLKRIKEFGPSIAALSKKDANGLYINKSRKDGAYMKNYFDRREVLHESNRNSYGNTAVGDIDNSALSLLAMNALINSPGSNNMFGSETPYAPVNQPRDISIYEDKQADGISVPTDLNQQENFHTPAGDSPDTAPQDCSTEGNFS